MTTPARRQLTLILAAAEPAGPGGGSWDAAMCGRPAADWLLDTAEALEPDALRFAGSGGAAIRERAEARPAFAGLLAAGPGAAGRPGQAGITVIMSGRSPLVQPATVRRALQTGA